MDAKKTHTSCMDEMTCATPVSHAVQCVNHDDMNLTNKQENCALTSVHVRCVEGVQGLGGHVVIGVVLGFTTQT